MKVLVGKSTSVLVYSFWYIAYIDLNVVVLIPQRRDALTNSIMKGIAWLKKSLAHPSLLPLTESRQRASRLLLSRLLLARHLLLCWFFTESRRKRKARSRIWLIWLIWRAASLCMHIRKLIASASKSICRTTKQIVCRVVVLNMQFGHRSVLQVRVQFSAACSSALQV